MRTAPRERYAICRQDTGGTFARFKKGETVTAQRFAGNWIIHRHPWTERKLPLTDICAGIPASHLQFGAWIPAPNRPQR